MPGWGGGKSRRCRNLHNPSPKTPSNLKAMLLIYPDKQVSLSYKHKLIGKRPTEIHININEIDFAWKYNEDYLLKLTKIPNCIILLNKS